MYIYIYIYLYMYMYIRGLAVDPLEWLDLEMLEDRRGREEGLIQRKVRRCLWRGPKRLNA